MLHGHLERIDDARHVMGGGHDASGDRGGGVEAGYEIEEEFGSGVADHHAVGIGAAEQVIGELKVFVNLGDGGAFLRRLGQLRRRAEGLGVFFEIVAGGGDDLFHDGRDDDHSGGDLKGASESLEEIEDEFVGAVEDEDAGGEDAAGDAFGNACGDGLVLELLGEGAQFIGGIAGLWVGVVFFVGVVG